MTDPNDFEGSVDGTIRPGLLAATIAPGKPTEVDVVKDSPLDRALKTGKKFRIACVNNNQYYHEFSRGSSPELIMFLSITSTDKPDALASIWSKPNGRDAGWKVMS